MAFCWGFPHSIHSIGTMAGVFTGGTGWSSNWWNLHYWISHHITISPSPSFQLDHITILQQNWTSKVDIKFSILQRNSGHVVFTLREAFVQAAHLKVAWRWTIGPLAQMGNGVIFMMDPKPFYQNGYFAFRARTNVNHRATRFWPRNTCQFMPMVLCCCLQRLIVVGHKIVWNKMGWSVVFRAAKQSSDPYPSELRVETSWSSVTIDIKGYF